MKPGNNKKVLVIGGGGREHSLVRKFQDSPSVQSVFVSPGNDGMTNVIRWNSDLKSKDGFKKLAQKALTEKIDLVVVGPDNPLADGIVDIFEEKGLLCFGPNAHAAQIEASKSFAKDIMRSSGVPTARFEVFQKEEDALKFVRNCRWENGFAVKADGLAFGKGVKVCQTADQALEVIPELYQVSGKLVIEERLLGQELSWMAFCDGTSCALLEPAKDYKPLFAGGPNTGGMGSFSPVAEVNSESYFQRVRDKIFSPTLNELKKRGCSFKGLLYAGLMWNPKTDQIWVIEFNARFGDPEAQVLLPRIDGDLYEWCEAVALEKLSSLPDRVPFKRGFQSFVVAASAGYPSHPEVGQRIQGELDSDHVVCAGVKKKDTHYQTSGGRVLGTLGEGESLEKALDLAYQRLSLIQFEGMQFRKDIGRETCL